MEKLLDSKDTGDLLGMNAKTVERLARQGIIPGAKIGRHWRYRESVLDQWIKKQIKCGSSPTVSE